MSDNELALPDIISTLYTIIINSENWIQGSIELIIQNWHKKQIN